MSNIDTYLNLDQSLRLRGLAKLSKAQLEVALANNKELQSLRGQLSSDIGELTGDINELNEKIKYQTKVHEEALSIQTQFLENQIKEIENKQIQNFHKQRLFQCKEYINDYYKLSDTVVKHYFLTNFSNILDELIKESKNILTEINDKEFALNLQTEISKINEDKTDDIGLETTNSLNELLFKIGAEKIKIIECNEEEKKQLYNKRQIEVKIYNEKKDNEAKENEKKRVSNLFNIRVFLTVVFGVVFLITFGTSIGYVAFLIMLFFLYSTIKINKQIKLNNSFVSSDFNSELEDILKKIDCIKLEIQTRTTNLKRIKEESDDCLKNIFQTHPEFTIVDYVLGNSNNGTISTRDSLFVDASRLIVQNQMGSTSLIQRRMKLGYNRAGQIMDQLEREGIVGPNLGSKAREVMFKTVVELDSYLVSKRIV